MSANLGFGKPQPQPKVSKRAVERANAAKEYEQMKADGLPDFEVYIRIRGKKNWYPVGVITVKRSNQINQAVFANQQELLQGAFRLYPVLKKNQNQLEYGYRLKQFKDEPIQIATEPTTMGAGGLGSVINQVKDRVTSIFKRSA